MRWGGRRVPGAQLLGLVNSSREQRTAVRSLCMVCQDTAFTGMSSGIRRKRDQGDGSQLGCLRRDAGQPSGGMGRKGAAVNTHERAPAHTESAGSRMCMGGSWWGGRWWSPFPPAAPLPSVLFLQLYHEMLTGRMGSSL